MTIYHDQVIEAAYIHTKPGCYFIGPFARRVSFASQQHRALDLVDALWSKGWLVSKTGRPKLCAVVGAGIAGLTACAALRGRGCKVHLFEKNKTLLALQSGAKHRLVHPTISRWPAQPLTLTTEFPFLDWGSGPADAVIRHMLRDWDLMRFDKPDQRPILGVEAKELRCADERIRLVLAFDKNTTTLPAGVPPPEGYELAIIATGFGEQEAEGLPASSYWDEDDVEAWRASGRKAIVSGCGDGGLIDALRLVHAHFDIGWLAVRLAHCLGDQFDTMINEAEDHALMAERSIAFMNFGEQASSPSTQKIGSRTENADIIGRLATVYNDVVDCLPKSAKDLLDESQRAANVEFGRVRLISRQVKPFSAFAAPIHKIMIAHALRGEYAISYERAELRAKKSRSMKAAKKTVVVNLDLNSHEIIDDAYHLIVRHASPANLKTQLIDVERNILRLRQLMLADYIDMVSRAKAEPPAPYPTFSADPTSNIKFVKTRYAMARDLINVISPGAYLTATMEGFVYHPQSSALKAAPAAHIPVPRSLFRIPLSEGVAIRVPAL